MGKFVSKPTETERSEGASYKVQDPAFEARWPALFEYLTLSSWEDGSPRQTASLSVFCEDGRFKACLNDREGDRMFFVSSAVFEDLLGEVEESCFTGNADWRAMRRRKK